MAISGGANDPYVHSNIANWSVGGYESLPSLVEKNKVNDSIASLEAIRNELKAEADKFLMGSTAEFMDYCINNEYNTYADIAVKLLQEPDAINALMIENISPQMSKKDISKLLEHAPELEKQIFNMININEVETVGVRTLAEELTAIFGDAYLTVGINGAEFVKPLVQSVKDISNMGSVETFDTVRKITGVMVKSLSSGKKTGKMIDAIENIIKKGGFYQQKNQQQFDNSVDSFINWFESRFIPIAKEKIKFYNVDQTPEQYVNDFKSQIKDKIKKNLIDIRNTVGKLGDEIIVSAWQADAQTAALGITVESIGSVMEKDVESKYGEVFKGVKPMITHHDVNKQSQTDILIKNANGMVARVQAKNASLANAEFSNDGLINLNAHLQRDRDLIVLLQALGVPNIENIAYTVANSLWFSAHDSVTGVRNSGHLKITNGSADANILSNLEQELSIFFSTKAENFLGITLNTAINAETKILSGASNLFFLKNGRFIPTYTLVEEVIADLQHYRDDGLSALQGLNFKINNPNNTSWVYNDDVDFWIEKSKEDFANRISIGTEQGAGAISSIVVHGIFPRVHELSSLKINTN